MKKELINKQLVDKLYNPDETGVMVIREINEELEKITNKDNWRGF